MWINLQNIQNISTNMYAMKIIHEFNDANDNALNQLK